MFRVIYLDAKNRMICFQDVFRGTLSTSVCHPRETFWAAIYHRAAGIIIAHNHPSGDPNPSPEDIALTKRMVNAGAILGIKVLDSMVICEHEYYSFADAGTLPSGAYSP